LTPIPELIEFLGRDPFEKETENLGYKIREYRRIHALTQKKMAEQLGVDQTTLAG
jgi:DNA-binding XRE family transcriptional regulator